MRSSILSWYDANPAVSINPPRSSAPPSILSRAFIISFPLPPSSFFDPPTLEESIASRPVRPTASEIVPLVLVVQQYASTVLFRSELSAGDNSNRPQVIWSAIEQCGNTLEWRRTLEGNINVENLEIEPVLKRVDGMMTNMFGTITKGCAGLDQVVRKSIFPWRLKDLVFQNDDWHATQQLRRFCSTCARTRSNFWRQPAFFPRTHSSWIRFTIKRERSSSSSVVDLRSWWREKRKFVQE